MVRSKRVMMFAAMCVLALVSGGASQGEAIEELPVVSTTALSTGGALFAERDGYLYFHNGSLEGSGWGDGGFSIVDISDPLLPGVVARYDDYYMGFHAFSGHYMFRGRREGSPPDCALHVIDISDPTNPTLACSVSVSYRPRAFEISGNYLYVAASHQGLWVYDISDPTDVRQAGWLNMEADRLALIPQSGEAVPILYVDSHEGSFVAGELIAMSLLDPAHPSVIDTISTDCVVSMMEMGTILVLVQSSVGERLLFLDGADPFVELGAYASDSLGGLAVGPGDRHLYISDYEGNFSVLDFRQPSAPTEVAHCETGLSNVVTVVPTPTHIYALGSGMLVITEALKVFEDVTWDSWAAAEIDACIGAGIVGGYPDGSYQPTMPVARDQMAVFIARAMAGGDDNVPADPDTATFDDVALDHWAFKYVESCVASEVVQGFDPVTYGPTVTVSRDAMAVFVSRAVAGGDENVPDGPADATFDDVPTDNWAYAYIEYCTGEGIVQGYDPVTYGPSIAVTRDQMAVYVARAFGL